MKDHISTSESNNGSAGCDFTTIGLVHVNNTVVFVAGDRVFTRSPDQNVPTVKTDGTGFRLDVDESITLQEAFDGLSELISLVPGVGWVLLAHTISGIIREAFVKAGFTPDTVLMIVGKSGMLKSSYVPQITQLYNRNDGVRANTRFNSTKRFIEDSLFEYRDCTYVIDDIHTGSSASIKKINETTAEEIIRQISDNTGRGRKNGSELIQRRFEGNAVFIGEYTIGAESTLPRVLFVEITEKPDGKILDIYQRSKRLLMSTFYSYFIQWYVDKFEDISVMIDNRLTKFRSSDTLSQVHGRLADAQFYLQISQLVLLEFCTEFNLITYKQARIIFQKFEIYISRLISIQQNRYGSQESCSMTLNYLNIIKELYHNGAFRLAKNQNEFDSNKHDGLIHYRCLCLRGKSIDKIVGQNYESYNRNKLIGFLVSKSALKRQRDKNTVQIKGGIRLYAIWLDKLEEAADDSG